MSQLATFYVGSELFAIDVLITKEIGKILEVSKVPGAQEFILGLMNLRGQVVTIIDPCFFLDQVSNTPLENKKLIIPKTENDLDELRRNGIDITTALRKDPLAIVVDQIGDVIDINPEEILPVPPNITGEKRDIVSGVVQLEKQLVIILAMDKLSEKCGAPNKV